MEKGTREWAKALAEEMCEEFGRQFTAFQNTDELWSVAEWNGHTLIATYNSREEFLNQYNSSRKRF